MNLFEKLRGRLPPLKSAAPAHAKRTVDARSINDTIERALASAGLDTRNLTGADVRKTIAQALAQAGLGSPQPSAENAPAALSPGPVSPLKSPRFNASRARNSHEFVPPGAFLQRSFSNAAGTRAYKLYVPAGYSADAAPVPLIVMLHGCTQSPDDFAAGTRMNALADAQGCLVAYPAQTPKDNGSKCWNWFRREDQSRGRGEPSLIAGIVGAVASDYRIDRRRVYIAGLSAGAAMAVILGETYPDVFAAVGAHSGLPFGAAHDVPSAFGAMQGASAQSRHARADRVPTIVIHGDADRTVDRRNGTAIIRDAIGAANGAPLRSNIETGEAAGRAYTREIFSDGGGRAIVEDWTVHGAAHAWSGGSASGTYTDPGGPDASAEMLRFFLQHRTNES